MKPEVCYASPTSAVLRCRPRCRLRCTNEPLQFIGLSADLGSGSSAQRSTTSSITTITTDTIVIPTYPYAAFLHTATNTTYNIPYRWLNWAQYEGSNPHPVDKTYTRSRWRMNGCAVSVLPELGGRVYELIYKPTASNELYQNPVIKPTHWGPPEQGWWLAVGGIEWGLPVEEHGYESAIPWSYEVMSDTQGVTVTLRDSAQPDRLRAAISVFLPNDRAALIVRLRLENERNIDLNFKWWDNAMLAPGPSNTVGIWATTRITSTAIRLPDRSRPSIPRAIQLAARQSTNGLPFYKNRDLSRLQNWGHGWAFARPAACRICRHLKRQWQRRPDTGLSTHDRRLKGFATLRQSHRCGGPDDDSYY
jgi:hypothetical protein